MKFSESVFALLLHLFSWHYYPKWLIPQVYTQVYSMLPS